MISPMYYIQLGCCTERVNIRRQTRFLTIKGRLICRYIEQSYSQYVCVVVDWTIESHALYIGGWTSEAKRSEHKAPNYAFFKYMEFIMQQTPQSRYWIPHLSNTSRIVAIQHIYDIYELYSRAPTTKNAMSSTFEPAHTIAYKNKSFVLHTYLLDKI